MMCEADEITYKDKTKKCKVCGQTWVYGGTIPTCKGDK